MNDEEKEITRNKSKIGLERVKVSFGKTPDYFKYDNVPLEKKERGLIQRLVEQYIHDETERANTYFDDYIDDYQKEMLLAISVLRKISKDGYLHRKSMGLDGGFTDEERKHLGINKDGFIIQEKIDDE